MSTTGSVSAEVRRRKIEAELAAQGSVRLTDLARELSVSEMTIRRDLAELEHSGQLRRVRGGATRATGPRPFKERSVRQQVAKARIAEKALVLLPERGAIALDASTTSGALAAALTVRDDLTVMTNSWENFGALRSAGVREALLTGGQADAATDSLVGPLACRSAASLNYEVLFASASSLHPEAGACDVSLQEAQVKAEFARAAQRVVLLADASKLGGHDLVRSFEWADVDILVTELDVDDARLDPYRGLVRLQ